MKGLCRVLIILLIGSGFVVSPFIAFGVQRLPGEQPTTIPNLPPCKDQPPVAKFTYSPAHPVVGEEVKFDASESSLPSTCNGDSPFPGPIPTSAVALWIFGDGSDNYNSLYFDLPSPPNIIGSTVTHTYSHPGAFIVILILLPIDTSDDGEATVGIAAKTISVEEGNQSPTANFTWQDISPSGTRLVVEPRTGDHIQFDASSSYDPDGTITKYE